MLVEIARGETYYIKPEITKGLDAAFLLLPAENHPLWGGAVRPLYEAWRRYPSAGSTCYLGVVALALAAAGAVHARLQGPGKAAGGAMREAGGPWFSAGGDAERNRMGPMASSGLWAGMFFVYLVLALGQELVVAGRNTGVPLLFALFDGFPLLETQRVANRFAVPAMLALSVLAACGARALIERSRRLPPAAVFWTIVVLAAADYLWAYPLRELPRPAWVEALRQAPAGLLLDIPGGHRARGSEDMYFQTLHGRPTVGGYTSCLPPLVERRVKELPFLELIFEGRPQVNVEVAAGLRDVLETLAVQVVVVHRDRARERLERLAGEHRGTPAARFYNPERGSPESVLAETRAALAGLWGAPRYSDAEAEIYWRP
jgi:hypothetical protein